MARQFCQQEPTRKNRKHGKISLFEGIEGSLRHPGIKNIGSNKRGNVKEVNQHPVVPFNLRAFVDSGPWAKGRGRRSATQG